LFVETSLNLKFVVAIKNNAELDKNVEMENDNFSFIHFTIIVPSSLLIPAKTGQWHYGCKVSLA